MRTSLSYLCVALFCLSQSIHAQSNDSASATATISSGPSVVTSPGVETDRARNPAIVPASSASSAVGILVKDGKAFLLRNGQVTAVEAPLTLTVFPDGAITGFDGQTITLPDNQMLTMDGRVTAIPAPLSSAMVPGLPAQSLPDAKAMANEEMARANSAAPTSTLDNQPTMNATDSRMSLDEGSGGGGSSNQPRKAGAASTPARP